MSTLLTVLHVIVCLFLMLTVLLQSGKGGGMGAAFGGGNAATVFGGSGASGFLKKMTTVAGTIFMITSMSLAFISSRGTGDSLDKISKEQEAIANAKEAARVAAIKKKKASGSGSGSAGSGSSGSGSMGSGSTGSGSTGGPTMTPFKPFTPSGSGSSGSAAGSGTVGSGSSKPVETPVEKPVETPVEKPVPAGSGSGSNAKGSSAATR